MASGDCGRTVLSTPVALWKTKKNVGIRNGDNRGQRNVEDEIGMGKADRIAEDQEKTSVGERKLAERKPALETKRMEA